MQDSCSPRIVPPLFATIAIAAIEIFHLWRLWELDKMIESCFITIYDYDLTAGIVASRFDPSGLQSAFAVY